MTLSPALSQSLSHFQASIEGSSPYLNVYSYHSIISLEEILAVVNQIVLSSFPRLLWPTGLLGISPSNRNGGDELARGSSDSWRKQYNAHPGCASKTYIEGHS
jgi:hypothetical protein